jgi:cell division protein ZapB
MDIIDQIQGSKTDIGVLEHQVEQLIEACSHLKEENDSLRQRQESLVAEKAELIEKTEIARTRVEAMISRLKSMENGL